MVVNSPTLARSLRAPSLPASNFSCTSPCIYHTPADDASSLALELAVSRLSRFTAQWGTVCRQTITPDLEYVRLSPDAG